MEPIFVLSGYNIWVMVYYANKMYIPVATFDNKLIKIYNKPGNKNN